MKTEAKKVCYIDEIFEKGNAVVFIPDTLEESHQQGYKNCRCCIEKKYLGLVLD